jgi:hypothetical protein
VIAGVTEAILGCGVRRFDLAGIASWLAGLYPDRVYPAAFIDSANGSVPHIADAVSRTMASVGCSIFGSGTSPSWMSPMPNDSSHEKAPS